MTRQIPLFPELRTYLEKVLDQAEPGTEYVITRYRDCNANLRTRLCRIIARAGLEPWPKLFQNLRATRETEFAETFPLHVVCAWIGNTRTVAAKHYYLQVTDEHFAKAVSSDVKAVRNPVKQPSEMAGNALQPQQKTPGIAGDFQGLPEYTTVHVGATGLELSAFPSEKSGVQAEGAAKCDCTFLVTSHRRHRSGPGNRGLAIPGCVGKRGHPCHRGLAVVIRQTVVLRIQDGALRGWQASPSTGTRKARNGLPIFKGYHAVPDGTRHTAFPPAGNPKLGTRV